MGEVVFFLSGLALQCFFVGGVSGEAAVGGIAYDPVHDTETKGTAVDDAPDTMIDGWV